MLCAEWRSRAVQRCLPPGRCPPSCTVLAGEQWTEGALCRAACMHGVSAACIRHQPQACMVCLGKDTALSFEQRYFWHEGHSKEGIRCILSFPARAGTAPCVKPLPRLQYRSRLSGTARLTTPGSPPRGEVGRHPSRWRPCTRSYTRCSPRSSPRPSPRPPPPGPVWNHLWQPDPPDLPDLLPPRTLSWHSC